MRVLGAAQLLVCLWLRVSIARAADACAADCTCVDGVQREYTCQRLDAVLQGGEYLRVTCTAADALHAPPALLNGTERVPAARFDDCSPPPAGWPAALRALGLTHVERLVLRAPEAFEQPYWRREHFAGMETLQALTLEGGSPAPADLLTDTRGIRRLTLRSVPLEEGGVPPLPPGDALSWLELGGTGAKSLPAGWLSAAPGLRGLVLWGAGGAAVAQPDALAGLVRLATLQLRRLSLASLPAGWLRGELLPALEAARLDACALPSVPADLLSGARALQNLSLAGNELMSLPAGLLADCPLLQRLELQGNRLVTLPDAVLAPVTKLLHLDLSSNGLERLSMSTFTSQSELHTLNLSNNKLTFASPPRADDAPDAFGSFSASSPLSRLTSLRVLVVSRNRLTLIPDDWRLTLQLARLDLSRNKLHTLTDADVNFLVFGNWTLEVDLRHNDISQVLLSRLNPVALEGADAPTAKFLLAGNPLRCDCRLHELLRRAAPRGPFVLDGAMCAAPPDLRAAALAAVAPERLACELHAPACPPACACALRPGLASGLLTLACAAPPAAAAWPAPHHYGLPASALRLTAPPAPHALRLPPHCRRLDLSALNITSVDLELSPLELLDLRNNSLSEFPDRLLRDASNGTHFLLAGNPVQCDCSAAVTVTRLQRAAGRIDDWREVRCVDGAPLSSARVAACPRAAWGVLGALAAAAALLAVGAAMLALRYARELRGWAAARGLACCWPKDALEEEDAAGVRYDAFVSYAHEDERWVTGELVPRLERAGLRLCLHFRDWEAGGWIPAQIERSVRASRRTLLVVSDAYLRSEWARHEWRAAMGVGGEGGAGRARAQLVVVLLGSPRALPEELRAHMLRHTYVAAGDPWFWSKLRVALPRRSVAPAAPDERRRRDVTRKLAFDDRLDALYATPAPAAAPASPATPGTPDAPALAERALLERLEPAALKL